MKKLKKVMALLLAMVMVLGMTTTVMAADANESETANLIITDITGDATVTLYQIAKGEYGAEGVGTDFIGYEYVTGVEKDDIEGENKPTSGTINTIANKLLDGNITPIGAPIVTQNVTGTFTKEVTGAGIWIAIITEASDGKVYNPIFLATSYNANSELQSGSVSSGAEYLYGEAVAKSTSPDINKEITGGTTPDEERETASVGDRIEYALNLTIPNYPKDAVNKTLFLEDTMSAGLTFEYDSLNVVLKNGDEDAPVVTRTDANNIYTYTANGKVIAQATKQDNGFYMNFTYDNLYIDNGNGAVYEPQVTYSAVLNDKAVVGDQGNKNKPTLIYSNKPNEGNTWDKPGERPQTGVEEKVDEKIVYTYQIAFKKSDNEENPLAGAVFGVYTDQECKNLIDTVITNEHGIGVSTKVEAGTYYVKELKTPEGGGFTLNDSVYRIEANQTSATKTVTGVIREYTSEKSQALDKDKAVQVGWLKNNVFYDMDTFNGSEEGVKPAYLQSESQSTETTVDKVEGDHGTSVLDETIINTKLAQLPSTGGIGTTIFTVAGCAIMIGAVALFFASRKKQNK